MLLFLKAAAGALKYLKDKRIVHLDLKPQNVVTYGEDFKIIDFDISRILQEGQQYTEVSEDIGTCFYKAPEWIEYGRAYFVSDIW